MLKVLRTVYAPPIGNEPEVLQLVHEVLEGGIDDIKKLRLNKTLNDPETVPIVLLPESSTYPGPFVSMFLASRQPKHVPGTTNVWLRGINELSHFPLDPQRVEELVPRMSCVQNPCTV